MTKLPVAIIGAGPIGLAAAAHLANKRERFVVVEAGCLGRGSRAGVGRTSRCSRRGATTSTPWLARCSRPRAGRSPIPMSCRRARRSWPSTCEPLAALPEIAPARAARCTGRRCRARRLRQDEDGRARRGAVRAARAIGRPEEQTFLARAVIDASGTFGDAEPARRQRAARDRRSGVPASASPTASPTCSASTATRYAGRAVLVVGSGHSAFNVLLDLGELAGSRARRRSPGRCVASEIGEHVRRRRGRRASRPAASSGRACERWSARGRVRLVTGFRTAQVRRETARRSS